MNYNKKKIPIGYDRFKFLREEDFYYVDKTGMIRELINSWGAVNLFTRPRRFGKSLNIDMLRTFFEIGTDASCFDGLEIMQEAELCEKYMGKFPVISVTLKDVDGEDFESACDALGSVIGDATDRLSWLLDSDKLSQYVESIQQRSIPELTYTDLDNEDATIRETYLWSVLYAAGYLTTASHETYYDLHELVIPNREIMQIYRDKIQSWYNINVRRDR